MCGICGILGSLACEKAELEKISKALNHRGPDDEGYYFSNRIALSNRRLSIIDIKGGHQPMLSRDKNYVIVYNGEVYNYRELRDTLQRKGFILQTQSDTEVVLNQFISKGVQGLSELNGMYAFAIWDIREETLYLARDPIGIKPLYYAKVGDSFVFASEIKALRSASFLNLSINIEAIRAYLSFRFFPQPFTIYKEVLSLEPGVCLKVNDKGIVQIPFWSWEINQDTSCTTEDRWIEELHIKSAQAIKRQEVSDVPLGAFLSGGVDSSLIAAIMQRGMDKPLKSFSIGFTDKRIDERYKALDTARLLSSDHNTLVLEDSLLRDNFETLIKAYDMPSGDGFQQFFLYKLAREHVTVSLSGTGADGLYGGYDWFRSIASPDALLRLGYYLPSVFQSVIKKGLGYIAPSKAFICDRYWGSRKDFLSRFLGFKLLLTEQEANRIIPGESSISPSIYISNMLDSTPFIDEYLKMVYLQTRLDLLNILLRDADVLSMSFSS